MGLNTLIRKYSTPGPRYTSYPTAPQFSDAIGVDAYRRSLRAENHVSAQTEPAPLGLYVHLPFCESLCYYCGCNIQITGDHGRSRSYVERVVREIENLSTSFVSRRTLAQISWGGGTPTFLNLGEIETLQRATQSGFDIDPTADVSIEIDPRVTSEEQLVLLRELGFNRVSLGVQDFEAAVQKAVHREQSAESTGAMLAQCRRLGYRGINFDLIYGLPHQTEKTFSRTLDQIFEMRPDRIALYNYARLPSLLPHQAILEKFPLPSAEQRVEIFTMAYDRLTQNGYVAIGMDHFALEQDALSLAIENGTLYRNFMGYVAKKGTSLMGVGASAIGEMTDGYFQNTKRAKDYEAQIDRDGFATLRGLLLSPEDKIRKWVIQKLMCQFEVRESEFQSEFGEGFSEHFADELPKLHPLADDRILEVSPRGVKVTKLGRLFVRNVAMVFDAYLKAATPGKFSKTV